MGRLPLTLGLLRGWCAGTLDTIWTTYIYIHPPHMQLWAPFCRTGDTPWHALQVLGISFHAVKEMYQMERRASTFEIIFTSQVTGRAGTL